MNNTFFMAIAAIAVLSMASAAAFAEEYTFNTTGTIDGEKATRDYILTGTVSSEFTTNPWGHQLHDITNGTLTISSDKKDDKVFTIVRGQILLINYIPSGVESVLIIVTGENSNLNTRTLSSEFFHIEGEPFRADNGRMGIVKEKGPNGGVWMDTTPIGLNVEPGFLSIIESFFK